MSIILVVEDDKTILQALELALSNAGHETWGALSGQAALDVLHASGANLPDLIIADMVMPGITGLQLLNAVRTRPGWENIPFLFISAGATREIEEQIAALEGTSLLHKPFEIEMLYEAVAVALS
jgi:CheY-like chemotaxis protein